MEIEYDCKHCNMKHSVEIREDYNGPILYTICPETNKGVVIRNDP